MSALPTLLAVLLITQNRRIKLFDIGLELPSNGSKSLRLEALNIFIAEYHVEPKLR